MIAAIPLATTGEGPMDSTRFRQKGALCVVVVCMLGLTGCTGLSQNMKESFRSDDPCANTSRNWGAVIGTVAGAALGAGIEKVATGRITGKGLALGAVGGALAGGIVGYEMDRRRCELSKIAKKHDLKVQMSEVVVPPAEVDPAPKPSQNESIVQVAEVKPSQAGPLLHLPEENSQPRSGQIEQVLQSVEPSGQSIPAQSDQPAVIVEPQAPATPAPSEHSTTVLEAASPSKRSPVEPVAQASASDSSAKSSETSKKGDRAGLSVSLQDTEGGHFSRGSADLLPKAQGYFREIAELYVVEKQLPLSPNASAEQKKETEELKQRRVLLLGHTDDTGSSQINADLSERRARAVAKVFMAAGVPNGQIFYQGAGETLPLADNRAEEGRAKNRRVEIVDLSNGDTFQRYLNSRKPRVDYYRPVASKPEPAATVSVPRETNAQESKIRESKASENTTHEKIAQTDKPQDRTIPETKKASPPTVPLNQPTMKAPMPDSSAVAARPTLSKPPSFVALDFGGKPAQSQNTVVAIGKIEVQRSISDVIIPSAYAAEDDVVTTCRNDRPRVSRGVKSLRDDREVSTGEYMPNLYNTSWIDTVNGHLVALTHVAVLRDGGAPARNPELLVYGNFDPMDAKGNAQRKPDYQARPVVNTYRGENALLYRVFTDGPIRCLDMVIPHANPREAKGSWLYYDRTGGAFVTGFKPHIAKTDR